MKTTSTRCLISVAALALVALTGCNTVSTTTNQSLGAPTFPPTDPALVEILTTAPTRPHIRLGEVQAEPSSDSVPTEKIKQALQTSAAKLGANAVVIVYDRNQVMGAMVTGPWYRRSIQAVQQRVIIGVAIRYQ